MTPTFGKKKARRSNRSVGTKEPRKRILLVLGALRTEKDYLVWVVDRLGINRSQVDIETKAMEADQLAQWADELGQSDLRAAKKNHDLNNIYSQIWVVVDVDNSAVKVKKARESYAKSSIRFAVSNPCFEVWLLFHTDCKEGPMSIGDAQAQAKRANLVDKRNDKVPLLDELTGKFQIAQDRSERLDRKHKNAGTSFPHNTPSSNVYELVLALKEMTNDASGHVY